MTQSGLADSSLRELQHQGTLKRLQGDFESAKVIEAQLVDNYDVPVGHIFALNGIITHLTWDETDTTYNTQLLEHADKTLAWCEQKLDINDTEVLANYYCGQARFALAYYHGLNGDYFQAGRNGTQSIEYLEAALQTAPNLTDAKMHLGVAYYIADNLPPFIKMFSRLLWFIPTGNSEKSLPYLQDVIEQGDQYQDVARYIYSVLLTESPASYPEAQVHLEKLVALYPHNARFQLRLISLLLIQDEYQATLDTALAYLGSNNPPTNPDLSLTRIWMVRAYLGLGQLDNAQSLFSEIDQVFETDDENLPGWSIAWHMLTDGQLHDLANNRKEAVRVYEEILAIAKFTYVSDVIIDAAKTGLVKPYRL